MNSIRLKMIEDENMKNIKCASLILIVLFILSVMTTSAKDIQISSPIVDEAALSEGPDKVPMIIGFNSEIGESDIQVLRVQGADIKRVLKKINAISVRISPQAISALEKNPNIKYITENRKVKLIEGPENVDIGNVNIGNVKIGDIDPLVQSLPWGVNKIDAELVHPFYKGAGVLVSITDTGVNDSHEDLIGRVVGQWDYVNNDADAEDDHGHGTHVAGTIAANNNTIGVIGVAPSVNLLAMKFLDSTGSGWFDDAAASIIDSVDSGADIISMSWGCSGSSACDNPVVRAAIQYANNSGVLLVAEIGRAHV